MRAIYVISLLFLGTPVFADEPEIDTLIKKMAGSYDRAVVSLRVVKDQKTAEAAANSLKEFGKEREQIMRSIGSLNLKPADRQAAQENLDKIITPVARAFDAEVARVSLIPLALGPLQGIGMVKDKLSLMEEQTRIRLRTLTTAMKAFMIKNDGDAPKMLQDVGRYLDNKDMLRDPWGREFQFDPAGRRNNGKWPDIWAISPLGDGKMQIGNWEVKR